MELRAAHEMRPEAPPELSTILHRMMASLPEERYQDYEAIIADLENLNIASEKLMQRDRPLVNQAQLAATQKSRWITRTADRDFRVIRWGMTHAEICAAEDSQLVDVKPAMVTVESEFKGQKLHTIYTFAMDEESSICISAAVSPWLTDFTRRSSVDDLRITPEMLERISGLDGAALEAEFDRFLQPQLESANQLDVKKLQDTYALMKEMIILDFGQPQVDDGPLQDEVVPVDHLVQAEGLDEADVRRYCQTSIWENQRTVVMLSIWPSIMGSRNIIARFMSIDHQDLFSD